MRDRGTCASHGQVLKTLRSVRGTDKVLLTGLFAYCSCCGKSPNARRSVIWRKNDPDRFVKNNIRPYSSLAICFVDHFRRGRSSFYKPADTFRRAKLCILQLRSAERHTTESSRRKISQSMGSRKPSGLKLRYCGLVSNIA